MILYSLFIMGIYSIFIDALYPICTLRNEVQNQEIYYFVLQRTATYCNIMQHIETLCSSFIADNQNINRLIAQKDIIQSNSMIESVNKHIKYYYLFRNELKDLQDTVTYLSTSVPNYNNKPHGRLYGLTPKMEMTLQRITIKMIQPKPEKID